MIIWNLPEISELEEIVAVTYDNPQRQSRSPARETSKAMRVKILSVIVPLVSYFTIGVVQVNSQEITLPQSATAVAQSIPEEKPPLDELFQGRFDNDWTPEQENKLLASMEQGRQAQSKEALVEQTIDTIYWNQQEGLSLELPRLDRANIAKLVRQRKIVR
mgnify:CR=1 FL=1